MRSTCSKLAANMSLGSFSKATELHKRLWFTLGALIIYRLGTYIPVPGIDASVMTALMTKAGGGPGGQQGGGGSQPAGGGPAPGGQPAQPHAAKQPPGAVHKDQMGAAGATPMPRKAA